MEEGVTVSNSVSLVINSPMEIISIIKGAIAPGKSVFYQRRFIASQCQFIDLAVIGCPDAAARKEGVVIERPFLMISNK